MKTLRDTLSILPQVKLAASLIIIAAVAAGCATNQHAVDAFQAGDCKTALEIWLPKAKSGDRVAQNNMGVLWSRGCPAAGVAQSLSQAAAWWLEAARQNFPAAYGYLGALYYDGKGVSKDQAKGLAYMSYAARWDVAQAREALIRIGQTPPPPDLAVEVQ